MRLVLVLGMIACDQLPPETETPYPTDTRTDSDTGVALVESVRVVTWNVEGLGDGAELDATIDVLTRLDADVLGLQEVDETEASTLARVAAQLGYDLVQLGASTPFGSLRNAVLSRLEGTTTTWSAPELSNDPNAMDVTRQPVSATVAAPWGQELTVVVQHCKAGFDDVDEFRRTVDAVRTAQAAAGATVIVGDINEDPREKPELPPRFDEVPPGAPFSYDLGDDISLSPGLVNGPFEALSAAGFNPVDAAQLDGRVETRDSGRWIDHVLPDAALRVMAIEIYDSRDDGPGGLAKSGSPPSKDAVRDASDHLPVLADVTTR